LQTGGTTEIPDNLKTPDLEKLLELRTQPTTENETPVELATRNFPLEFFVETLLPAAVGSKGWREDMCTKKLSDTRATVSDEAFVLLCLENMWGKWHSTTGSKHDRGKYTNGGSNRKYSGWSVEGIKRFNELLRLVVKNRKRPWSGKVEEQVMKGLREKHYHHKTLEEVRSSKTRKRRRGIGEIGDEMVSLPVVAWDVSAIELDGDSDADNNA